MDSEAKSILTRKIFPSRFYDNSFVAEYGRIESLRASRYNTSFSVVLMNISGLDRAAMKEGSWALDLFKKLVTTVLESVRNCDVVGLVDEREIIAILPETDHFGSLATIRKLTKAIIPLLRKQKPPVSVIFSQATFPKDGRGYGELFSTAARRVSEKRESSWEKLDLKNKLFWEIVSRLSGENLSGFDGSSFETGGERELSEFFADQINELIIKEVARTPQKRGILYFSAKKVFPGLPLIKNLGAPGPTAAKVFIVGEGEDNIWEIKNATPIILDDPRLRETFFTFFLNEDSGYALISKENWGATYSCFHTADPYLVEGLIMKFQSEYSLQEQLG